MLQLMGCLLGLAAILWLIVMVLLCVEDKDDN
jgi:hypothetical protein